MLVVAETQESHQSFLKHELLIASVVTYTKTNRRINHNKKKEKEKKEQESLHVTSTQPVIQTTETQTGHPINRKKKHTDHPARCDVRGVCSLVTNLFVFCLF